MGQIEMTKNNAAAVSRELEKKIDKALRIIGMNSETYAKKLSPVDTGLLRNSITFAIGGESPNITEYTDDAGENRQTYEGQAPQDGKGEKTVYIGTNVHYAIYQELGHMTVKGDWVDPQEFLRPAVENHTSEIADILKKEITL